MDLFFAGLWLGVLLGVLLAGCLAGLRRRSVRPETEAEDVRGEEARRRLREEQEAFDRLQAYTAEQAYGAERRGD